MKITTIYKTYILILSCTFLHCTSTKQSTSGVKDSDKTVDWILRYDRGPCFGTCPVYTFYLLSDYNGLIEVKANLLEPGWYFANLDQEDIHDIITELEPGTWWNENLSNEPEIADLPFTNIAYKHQDGLRRKEVQTKISHQCSRVFEKVGHLVQGATWISTHLRPLDPEVPQPDILVLLREGIHIDTWMKKFESYGILLRKRVAPRLQYYVVSKMASSGSSTDFLNAIKADGDVIDAQWDRALTPRGE